MNITLFALYDTPTGIRTWGLGDFLVGIVILAAVVALVLIALRVFKITLPEWFWHVVGIVVAAVVIIWAIRYVLTL